MHLRSFLCLIIFFLIYISIYYLFIFGYDLAPLPELQQHLKPTFEWLQISEPGGKDWYLGTPTSTGVS